MQIKVVPISLEQRFNSFNSENQAGDSDCSGMRNLDFMFILGCVGFLMLVAVAYKQYEQYNAQRREAYQ